MYLDWFELWDFIFGPPDHAGDLWQHTDIQTTRIRQVRVPPPYPSSSVHIHDDTGVNFCSDVLPQRCVAWRALEAEDQALTRNRYTRWPRPALTAASLCQGCCGSLLPLLGGCERMCVQCFYSRETPKSSLSKIPFLQIQDRINNFKKKTSTNEHLIGTGSFWCLFLRYWSAVFRLWGTLNSLWEQY